MSLLVFYDFFYKFNWVGRCVFYVFDVYIGLEMLSYVIIDDVVIVVIYSGYMKEVLLVCEYVKENKVFLIVIMWNDGLKIKNLVDEVFFVLGNEYLLCVGVILFMYLLMIVGMVLYLGVI